MAQKLRDYYDFEYAESLADKIKHVNPVFNSEMFLAIVGSRLGSETFLKRQDIYVDALEHTLGDGYKENLEMFKRIWGDELKQETGMFKEGWWLWPVGRYVERHACEDPIASYEFIKEFTKRQTGEYAIRPLLISHTKLTMEHMLSWSKDKSVHVRRLSSEGLRIYLPWTPKTTAALNHFDLYKTILTNLKDDTSKFVQKSVGNNINDLYKYDSKMAEELVNEWLAGQLSKQTMWIIKHGKRSIS